MTSGTKITALDERGAPSLRRSSVKYAFNFPAVAVPESSSTSSCRSEYLRPKLESRWASFQLLFALASMPRVARAMALLGALRHVVFILHAGYGVAAGCGVIKVDRIDDIRARDHDKPYPVPIPIDDAHQQDATYRMLLVMNDVKLPYTASKCA
eukprot:5162273-Pleurochrysis_carterae.AAC.1